MQRPWNNQNNDAFKLYIKQNKINLRHVYMFLECPPSFKLNLARCICLLTNLCHVIFKLIMHMASCPVLVVRYAPSNALHSNCNVFSPVDPALQRPDGRHRVGVAEAALELQERNGSKRYV